MTSDYFIVCEKAAFSSQDLTNIHQLSESNQLLIGGTLIYDRHL